MRSALRAAEPLKGLLTAPVVLLVLSWALVIGAGLAVISAVGAVL